MRVFAAGSLIMLLLAGCEAPDSRYRGFASENNNNTSTTTPTNTSTSTNTSNTNTSTTNTNTSATALVGVALERVCFAAVAVAPGARAVRAPDGRGTFVFDERGRHLRTVAADGSTRFVFGYDADGVLDSVLDLEGREARLAGPARGAPAWTAFHLAGVGEWCAHVVLVPVGCYW